MAFNFLLDTDFLDKSYWSFTNCYYDNKYLISNNRVFGIEQEITLPVSTKVYCRFEYCVFDNNIKDVILGIQSSNSGVLECTRQSVKVGKKRVISVVKEKEAGPIKIRLIFQSKVDHNTVYIASPVLADLRAQSKYTWLKCILDKTVDYEPGYCYHNLMPSSEVVIPDQQKGVVGTIVPCADNVTIPIEVDLKKGKTYLFKLCYDDVNKHGTLQLKYGESCSVVLSDSQQYLLIRASGKHIPEIKLTNTVELPYVVNLKYWLLIDITNQHLLQEDIGYLPYMEMIKK